ncbi:MAG: hypothetical protein B6D55_04205 [Candidatus Omnitrophica bacterium 4484_70.2]|nr:MAG: hypothetical protein B6D55_04205 [Candidatus Omnitrophica bacterium 4484_70.2]
MRITLFTKIFYPFVFIFAFSVVITTILFVNNQTHSVEKALIKKHILLSEIVASQIEDSYKEKKWPLYMLKNLAVSEDVIFWHIVDSSGKIRLSSLSSFQGKIIKDKYVGGKKINIKEELLPSTKEKIKVIIYPLMMKDGKMWNLRIGVSLKSVKKVRRNLILWGLLLAFLVIFLFILVSFLLVKNITLPLNRLLKAARKMSEGDLDVELRRRSKDEFGTLVDLFSKMGKDLKESAISLNYFNSIIQAIGEALVVTDKEGKIELINNAGLSLLKYTQEEIIGKSIREFFPNYKDLEKIPFQETEWLDKEKKKIPVLCSMKEIKDNHELINRVYVARDIRDIKEAYSMLEEAQRQLIQTEKMAVLGKLSSGIVHEIRNPLSIITQGIYFLEKKPSQNKDFQETVVMIKEAAERINHIITRLLGFARASHLTFHPYGICAIIEEGISLVESQARLRNIEIERVYPEEDIIINADKTLLSQVFLNLATNSLDAISHDGKITICVEKENDFCKIEFSDTGCGISEEDIEKIFDLFYTKKREGKGTGLGLSIVALIISKHKGKIDVESRPGVGTKFTIRLPIFKEV